MAPDEILLIVHILAGFTALTAAAVATLTKTLDGPHRWHVYSGTVFFWGMAVIFVTALPLAVIRPNAFLFLIAILSFYFALAGWRYATLRRGPPRSLDWISASVMALAAGIMIAFGVFLLSRRDTNGITMLALGGIGAALSIADLRILRAGGAKGRERIARHLTMMLAGAIATVTAFVVTNVAVQPAFIVWLAPTVVITPIIIVWNRRIRAGKRVRGMPESILPLVILLCAPGPGRAQITHRMTLEVDEPQEVISRHIYGHFAEHLGRGIYEGIWARDGSGDIAIREDVVEALRAIKIPNLRWPGGCFADYYFWRDGIGPREDRPSIVNAVWGGVTEDNSVGTHEFMELVDALDTEPIVVGNVGSATVQDMAQWWEYMNHPGPSPMADLRKANGRDGPWNVRFWGVGNESWGCGGNMRPEFYADQYRRFATFLHPYSGVRPFRIAAGPAGADYTWTEVLMRDAGRYMDGLDLHHYTIIGSWETQKGHATEFTEAEWFELLESTYQWVELLDGHKAVMDRYDPEKRVWLIIGEWGTWHEPLEGSTPGFLHQQQTLRDALSASTTLDIFHRHLDRVKMANIAQTVNVLQAMILTEGDEMILTPTYHVFEFYTVHHDATYLAFELDGGEYRFGERSIPAVTATASRNAEGRVHVTLTNLDPNNDRTIEIDVRGENVSGVSGRILTAEHINAHNTFEQPATVSPADFSGASVSGGTVSVELPAKSLVVLELAR